MSSPPHGSVNALRCAKCRYPVIGLTEPICPECGSDLREVGLRRPGQFPIAEFVIFGVALAALIGAVGLILANALPRPALHEITLDQNIAARSLNGIAIRIAGSYQYWQWEHPNRLSNDRRDGEPDEFRITARNSTGKVIRKARINTRNQTFEIIDRNGTRTQHTGRFTQADALAWLKPLPIGLPPEKRKSLADYLEYCIEAKLDMKSLERERDRRFDRAVQGDQSVALFAGSTGGSSGIRSDDWLRIIAIALGTLVWLAACIIVYRRWSKPIPFDSALPDHEK